MHGWFIIRVRTAEENIQSLRTVLENHHCCQSCCSVPLGANSRNSTLASLKDHSLPSLGFPADQVSLLASAASWSSLHFQVSQEGIYLAGVRSHVKPQLPEIWGTVSFSFPSLCDFRIKPGNHFTWILTRCRVHPKEISRFQHFNSSHSFFTGHYKIPYWVNSFPYLGNIQRRTLWLVSF